MDLDIRPARGDEYDIVTDLLFAAFHHDDPDPRMNDCERALWEPARSLLAMNAVVPVSGKNASGKTEGGFSWQVVAIPAAVEGGSLRPGALQDIEVVVGWEDGRKNRQVRLHSVVAGRGE